ncbi:hypothetical protein Sste5346_003007 [Sporothrix stenoceras]|uniref:Spindle pole body component n=1 Tax=Sporothrix stenoceras TaxID=5173 RepID=A0ABR3ZG96_9PEZI
MADTENADLFAIPDFWKLSSWQQQQPPPLAPEEIQHGFFSLDVNGDENITFFLGKDEPEPLHNTEDGDGLFKIPDLLSQLLPSSPESIADNQGISSVTETVAIPASLVDDFWLLPDDSLGPPPLPELKTWASFEHADIPGITPIFATEQGPKFVDALIAAHDDLSRPQISTEKEGGNDDQDLGILDTREYCACLLALALGRSSVLFLWNDSKRSFLPMVNSARISGFTAQVLRSVEKDCLDCGNNSRYLRAFVDHTYTAAASASSPSRVALARGVDNLLLTIQSELGTRGHTAHSLLQLQALVRPVASLVKFIRGLVTKLSRSTASSGTTDEKFLTMLYQEAQSMEYSVVFMRDIIKQLLQLVSEPWLAFVGEWIGLSPKSKATLWTGEFQSKGFVRLDDRVWIDDMGTELAESDYFFDEARMPAFIPEEMAKDLFETGRNLRFLWTNHPGHPLSNPTTVLHARPPTLGWQFDWDSIHVLDRKALAYERTLLQSFAAARHALSLPGPERMLPIHHHPGTVAPGPSDAGINWRLPTIEFQFFGKSEDQIEQSMQTSMAQLGGPLPRPSEDGLAVVLRRQLFKDGQDDTSDMAALDEFAPHWSLLPLLSFGPVIAAQSRLVNRECMRLLFGSHGIREHLQLQREFQLLGNGMFCSRLSHALFDPDQAGAERSTGIELSSGGLGLRLSSRNGENWPPASSELRLALMGVLAESYYQGRKSESKEVPAVGGTGGKHELPGGMSFAVRDLSIEEMDRCMDPDSLEALDFLRLSYKPPSALLSVITPGILAKYDRVFLLLLRVLRMYYVVNQLFEDDIQHRVRNRKPRPGLSRNKTYFLHEENVCTRFRIECRHFVANIMAYFLGTGVDIPWKRFEAWLDGVQQGLTEQDQGRLVSAASAAQANQASPDKLRERHEQALDEIMLALLLRKRQQPLLLLLQGIFGLILDFAKSSRDLSRAESAAEGIEDDGLEARRSAHQDKTKKLHTSFRKKVAAFLAVCRGLSEKEADSVARKDYQQQQQYQDGSRAGEGSSLSKLLLMLDYNGSYSSSRTRW